MTSQERAFFEFAAFAANLNGDEKSEAQTFLLHLLDPFGHDSHTLSWSQFVELRSSRRKEAQTASRRQSQSLATPAAAMENFSVR
jgi:hypothetical protein